MPDMLVHDACANIVRIDRRLSDRGRRRRGTDRMTARSDARDSVPDNGTVEKSGKKRLIIKFWNFMRIFARLSCAVCMRGSGKRGRGRRLDAVRDADFTNFNDKLLFF